MIRTIALSLGLLVTMTTVSADEPMTALDFEMAALNGDKVDLGEYEGKVVLIANTASKCGATPQYAELQSLYEKYKDDGLVILGFPCNQFGRQEPGSSDEIATFCEVNYGVEFPMFSKIEVNGTGTAPLFNYLKTNAPDTGDVKWNFEKFLVSRDGKVVERFRTATRPSDADVVAAIERELSGE